MKKCVKKSIGLMLVASMTVSDLTGCGSTAEESKDTTSKNNVEKTDNSKTSNVEEILTNKMDTSKDSEKKESVYVEMDAEGNVTKTTVSDELKVSGSENITDYSNLSDIKILVEMKNLQNQTMEKSYGKTKVKTFLIRVQQQKQHQ
ncbi:MAG: hypothetical protein ACLUR5_11885 [Eubacterium ventriosum]